MPTSDDERLENHRAPDKAALPGGVQLTEVVSPYNEALSFEAVTGLWQLDNVGGLGAIAGEIARQATMIGYNNAFLLYTVACFSSLAFVMIVKIKR